MVEFGDFLPAGSGLGVWRTLVDDSGCFTSGLVACVNSDSGDLADLIGDGTSTGTAG